jgi:hypothetical protein
MRLHKGLFMSFLRGYLRMFVGLHKGLFWGSLGVILLLNDFLS